MITEILQHNISYSWNDGVERKLDECDIEHIEQLIKDGFNQGELCQTINPDTGDEASGWWSIEKLKI